MNPAPLQSGVFKDNVKKKAVVADVETHNSKDGRRIYSGYRTICYQKMDKLRAEYGGFPGDLHFGLTKRPARVSRCMKEEQKFLTGDRFQSCPWRNVMTLRRRWGFLISFPNGSALTSQSAVFLH